MRCPSCHQDNRPERRFCAECGGALSPPCPACGSANEPGEKFCGGCGAALTTTTATALPRPPATSTPRHLVDRILASRAALAGERKQVSVLFADVQGSMELAAQTDPEEWSRIMQRFFTILADGVERFEGFVDKFTGDGIMALFGAPIAHEDHAQRACYAALHLRDELARYATEVKREHGLGFSTRMGIHSGEVVVGAIGDDLRMDYTAQGHTVGLAQRMESLAEPNTCYVSAATAALASGYLALEDLGDFRVKGVAEPLRVHRLAGLGASRTRFDISRSRGLSRFVGRSADLRALEDALEQSAACNGQVVGVVAEAGTGKSRLCFEFLERCRARGMSVYEARAVAHGRNIPFLPILELFRAYFGITLQDDDRSAREKIAGRLVVLDQRFTEALPLLYDFLGVSDPQRPAPRLDPDARQRQLIGVMRQVTQTISEEQPTVTLIEDLHWLDAASAEFLEHNVDARAGSRSLLVLNFRPEYRADWMQKSWYRQIPLAPLGVEGVAELLTGLLGSDPGIATLAAPIHARTGGNPFFTEEVVQSLIESGHLAGTRGAYRLVAPIERLQVPATVQALLASRIDRLPEREKRLLQVAAVIGKDFPEPLLAAVAELPAEDLKAALASLCRTEFIHEQALYPVAEYAFKHPLTQEVALASQLRERRREVHAAVARAIEQQETARLDELAPLLAQHWEEAGDLLAAARWHRRAAEWVGSTNFGAASYHWGRVRALLRELPGDREAAVMGLAACMQILNTSWRVGAGIEDAPTILAEGQAFAHALGDRRAHLILSMLYGRVRCSAGYVAEHLELAPRNYDAARTLADPALQATAAHWHVDALAMAARFPAALEAIDAALEWIPRRSPATDWITGLNPYTVCLFWRGVARGMASSLREGIEDLELCRRLALEDGAPEIGAYADLVAAEYHYLAGAPDQALRSARQLEDICRRLGDPTILVAYQQAAQSWADLGAGRVADTITAARSALEFMTRVEKQAAGNAALALAEAMLLAGDYPAAVEAARQSIDLSSRSLRAQYEAQAHGVLARALLRRDGAAAREGAAAALASAAALIGGSGATTLLALLCEWRAELADVLGDEVARRELLQQAQRRYEEIGAPLQAARIARELDA